MSQIMTIQAKESVYSLSFCISLLKFPRFNQKNEAKTLSQYVRNPTGCNANL